MSWPTELPEDIGRVAYLFHRNFEQVTKGLCWLRLISVVSPLLGLLETILGMVTVFRTIAENAPPTPRSWRRASGKRSSPRSWAVRHIPMLMFYYYLMLKFKGFHIEAVEHSTVRWNCAAARRVPGPKTGECAMHDFDEDASIDRRRSSTLSSCS
ncbi:MAG: MotA/TolQ/ExbB proton channel family protein [Bilophila wadsworthia]